MKLGAESKKVAILATLLAIAAYFFYANVISSGEERPAAPRAASSGPARLDLSDGPGRSALAEVRPRLAPRAAAQEFRPILKASKPGEGPDPVSVDPTLRLDLLAKVQSAKIEGGERNLFQFGPAPPPKIAEAKIVPKPASQLPDGTKPGETPAKPPAPPIPLKFYGYTSQGRAGEKRAFFLDGDEIVVASEGELIKRRYKVVRIGINSVVVEDVEQQNRQTLPLEEQTG
jgi:hypothetical protein